MTPAVVTVAPGKTTAKLSVGVARELVRRVPSLERLVAGDGDTADGFSLRRPDGGRVSFVAVAASRGDTTLRGYDILALILDESEFLASNSDAAAADGYVINDRDLWNAAKPRLHGPAVFISTPWPVENLTAELFDRKSWPADDGAGGDRHLDDHAARRRTPRAGRRPGARVRRGRQRGA